MAPAYLLSPRATASGTVFAPPAHFVLTEPVDCVQFLVLITAWGTPLHGFVVMQQPPRLVHPQGNAGSGAGPRSGAAPVSVPAPLTPRKKGEELDKLIRSLEDQYQLDFSVTVGLRSPAKRKTTANALEQRIQFLFFSHRPALDDALARFATTGTFIPKEQRVDTLLSILRNTTQCVTPTSRSGTPLSTKNIPPKVSSHPSFVSARSMESYSYT